MEDANDADRFYRRIAEALKSCQLIEQELKLYIAMAYEIIRECVAERLPFRTSSKNLDNASLKRLIEVYRDLCDDDELTRDLFKFKRDRDRLAHRGIASCLNPDLELDCGAQADFEEMLDRMQPEAERLWERIRATAVKLHFEDLTRDKGNKQEIDDAATSEKASECKPESDTKDIIVYRFLKGDFDKLKEPERILIMQLGNICNELAFFHKLLLVVSDAEHIGAKQAGATMQALIVVRVFFGKIFEAWRVIGREYFSSDLPSEFDNLLPDDAIEARKRLGQAFGKDSFLSKMRNKFGFHYDSEHVSEILSLMSGNQQFRIIGAGAYDDTIYRFAEDVVAHGMLNQTDESDVQDAMDKVIGELVDVSGDLLNYANHLLSVILWERLSARMVEVEDESEQVTVEAELESFKMPFFFRRKSVT